MGWSVKLEDKNGKEAWVYSDSTKHQHSAKVNTKLEKALDRKFPNREWKFSTYKPGHQIGSQKSGSIDLDDLIKEYPNEFKN